MRQRLTPSDVEGLRVYWLLTLTLGGQEVRLAEEDLELDDDDGNPVTYAAGLQVPDVVLSLDLDGGGTGETSIPLEVVLPFDVAARIAQGLVFAAGRGELARWVEGTTWDSRHVVMVGELSDPEYGEEGEVCTFTLEAPVSRETAAMIPVTQRVDGYTWAHADTLEDEHLGLRYPLVYGRPGVVPPRLKSAGWCAAAPARWVWWNPTTTGGGGHYGLVLVIAGHHVSAERVYINNDVATGGARVLVRNGWDQRGQPVAYLPWWATSIGTPSDPIEFDGLVTYSHSFTDVDGSTTYSLGHTVGPSAGDDSIDTLRDSQLPVYVAWYDEESVDQGGLTEGGVLVRDAGDVLLDALRRSGRPVDVGRFRAVSASLSRYKIDAWVGDDIAPWDWVSEVLLPLLPVALATGPSGIYPVLIRHDAGVWDVVARVDADTDAAIHRLGRVRYESRDFANRITLRWAYNLRTGNYLGSATYGPREGAPDPGDDDVTYRLHPRCQEAYDIDRRLVDHEVSTAAVYDESTAWAILEHLVAERCVRRRLVTYAVPADRFVAVERAALVAVTDAAIHLDEAIGQVIDVEVTAGGAASLTVRLQQPSRGAT